MKNVSVLNFFGLLGKRFGKRKTGGGVKAALMSTFSGFESQFSVPEHEAPKEVSESNAISSRLRNFEKREALLEENRKKAQRNLTSSVLAGVGVGCLAAFFTYQVTQFNNRVAVAQKSIQLAAPIVREVISGETEEIPALKESLALIDAFIVEKGITDGPVTKVAESLRKVISGQVGIIDYTNAQNEVYAIASQAVELADNLMAAEVDTNSPHKEVFQHIASSARRIQTVVDRQRHNELDDAMLANAKRDYVDIGHLLSLYTIKSGKFVHPGNQSMATISKLATVVSTLPVLAPKAIDSEFRNEMTVIARTIDADAADAIKSLIDGGAGSSPLFAMMLMSFVALLGVTAAAFVFYARLPRFDAQAAVLREEKANQEKSDTDEAIVRLMREIFPISEGDLTARATVSEHVIGTIADRVNVMAESLLDAIKNVRSNVLDGDAIIRQIQKKTDDSMQLFEDAAFASMESREVAQIGESVVSGAVERMGDAREKMQDVSKRIKRLGEASQSISNVVTLIEELVTKTSILALNTSVKASESGEEGAPYRVIAKEIRELSEDAKRSLAKIGQHVTAIQSETNTVIATVESLTSDVVEGSKLWDESRIALRNITDSSTRLTEAVAKLREVSESQVEDATAASDSISRVSSSIEIFQVQ